MVVGDKDALLLAIFDNWIAEVHRNRPVLKSLLVSAETGPSAATDVAALFAPFLQLFAQHLGLAREYGAILFRGNHGSVIFEGLATSLKVELANVLQHHGLVPTKAIEAANIVYFSYLGILLGWAGGSYDQNSALNQLTSIVSSLTNPLGR